MIFLSNLGYIILMGNNLLLKIKLFQMQALEICKNHPLCFFSAFTRSVSIDILCSTSYIFFIASACL